MGIATLHPSCALNPVRIEECRALLAGGEAFEFIAARAAALCAELGTHVARADSRLWLEWDQR